MPKRQVMLQLIAGQGGLFADAGAVLQAGRPAGRWINVDDRGVHHGPRDGVWPYTGNDDFAWFGATERKAV